MLDAVEEKDLSVTTAHQGDDYSLGDAGFTIIAPCEGKDYKDELITGLWGYGWSTGIPASL